VPHVTYFGLFVGGGCIFLWLPWRSKADIINDISRDVATLFRVLHRHYGPLTDLLRRQVTSRVEFECLVQAVPDSLTRTWSARPAPSTGNAMLLAVKNQAAASA